MKLYNQDGGILYNATAIHIYEVDGVKYGYGTDSTKVTKPYQEPLINLYMQKTNKKECSSDNATVVGVFDGPPGKGGKLLSTGISWCSKKDDFDRKMGLLIALGRAAFELDYYVQKRLVALYNCDNLIFSENNLLLLVAKLQLGCDPKFYAMETGYILKPRS